MKDKINNFKRMQEEDEAFHKGPMEEIKRSIDANVNAANHAGHVFDIFLTKIIHTITHFAGGKDDAPPQPSAGPEGRHNPENNQGPGGGR